MQNKRNTIELLLIKVSGMPYHAIFNRGGSETFSFSRKNIMMNGSNLVVAGFCTTTLVFCQRLEIIGFQESIDQILKGTYGY